MEDIENATETVATRRCRIFAESVSGILFLIEGSFVLYLVISNTYIITHSHKDNSVSKVRLIIPIMFCLFLACCFLGLGFYTLWKTFTKSYPDGCSKFRNFYTQIRNSEQEIELEESENSQVQ